VLAGNRQTLVLGGLIEDRVTETVKKVPLLGDIPVLGILFRAKSVSRGKQNLMVFLRPTIIRDNKAANDLSASKYLGVRALALEIDSRGDIARVQEGEALPLQMEGLFNGRGINKPEEKAPEEKKPADAKPKKESRKEKAAREAAEQEQAKAAAAAAASNPDAMFDTAPAAAPAAVEQPAPAVEATPAAEPAPAESAATDAVPAASPESTSAPIPGANEGSAVPAQPVQ
jgi:hypothetical protein